MDIASQIKDYDRSFAMPQSPFRRGISAVAGLGSSLLSAAFNHKLAEKSAKVQYDRQLSFWEKQNAYNHPAAQRRRFEAAGFNAAAASGQIAGNNQAGGLSSVPGNEYAQGGVFQQETFSEALRMFAELRSVNLDNENTRRQIQLSYLEELLKKGELAGVELSNQEKSTMLRYLDEAQESNLKLMFEELRNRQNDNHRKEADNAAYDEYRAAGGNQYTEAAALTDAQIREIESNITSNAHRDDLTDAQRAYYEGLEQLAIFQRGIAALDFSQRQQEVSEFLNEDNVRYRQFAREVQHGLTVVARNQVARREAIASLTDEYERRIAESILNASEGNRLDAVLLQWLVNDPGRTLNVLNALGNIYPDSHDNTSYHSHNHTTYINN